MDIRSITAPLWDFWALVVEVWRHGLLGMDIGRLLVAVGILIGFLVLRRLFTRFVVERLVTWTDRTETPVDGQMVRALEGPIRFLPVVLAVFFALEYLSPEGTFASIGGNLVRSMIAFTLFWGLHNLVNPLSFLFERLERVFSTAMVDWVLKAIRVAFILIGGATILEVWGIQVAPIIAGLGLLGVAVALGAQDLFKNLIAGILIIAEKRFNKGDWILVDGVVEGTVETVGFRSTTVRRFDRAPVHVPNAKLSDNAVTNFSAMTHRRIYWHIGVEHRTSIDQLRRIRDDIEAFILNDPDFAPPSEVSTFVRIDRFSDSSIDIILYCFTRTTVWLEWLKVKERLAFHVKQVVKDAGASFALPSRTLYVEHLAGERAEVFVPPGTGSVADRQQALDTV
ncbi:MAG: mechanosensitive ion channel family protein [Rhodospirillaceae bacterium]